MTAKDIQEFEEMEVLIRGAVYAALLLKMACKFLKSRTQREADEVIET